MTYFKISNKRYYILVIAIVYLILHHVIHGLKWPMVSSDFNFLNVAFVLSNCVLYLIFVSYFSFYQLTILKWLSLAILIGEILQQTLGSIFPGLPELIFNLLTASILILEIIWIIYTLKLDSSAYRGVKSLKNYSWAIIISFVLSILFMLIAILSTLNLFVQSYYLLLTIPYFMALKFAGAIRETEILKPS